MQKPVKTLLKKKIKHLCHCKRDVHDTHDTVSKDMTTSNEDFDEDTDYNANSKFLVQYTSGLKDTNEAKVTLLTT